jgi:uncharacterized protein YlaI
LICQRCQEEKPFRLYVCQDCHDRIQERMRQAGEEYDQKVKEAGEEYDQKVKEMEKK